jgi:hypothetical protein
MVSGISKKKMNKLKISNIHPESGIRLLKIYRIPSCKIQEEYLKSLVKTQEFHHEFWRNSNINYKTSIDREFLVNRKEINQKYYKEWILLNFKIVKLGILNWIFTPKSLLKSKFGKEFIGFRSQGITVR